MPDSLDQGKAIHLRHVHVGHDKQEGLSGTLRLGQPQQGRLSTFDERRFHLPALENCVQDTKIGPVVVNHQDLHARQNFGRHDLSSIRLGWVWNFELYREMKLASPSALALHPDLASHHRDQAHGDAESKPRSSVLAGGRIVSLGECLED